METNISFKAKDYMTKQELIDFLNQTVQYIQALPNGYSYSSNGLFIMSKPIENNTTKTIEDNFVDASYHKLDNWT